MQDVENKDEDLGPEEYVDLVTTLLDEAEKELAPGVYMDVLRIIVEEIEDRWDSEETPE